MDDPDSIETIIRFVEEKHPNQIITFLNLEALKTELVNIEMELHSELTNRYNSDDELDENEDIQTVREYIALLNNPGNNYSESLYNYNIFRINRMIDEMHRTIDEQTGDATRRTPLDMKIKPERTKGGRNGRRTRHRKKSRRTRHRRKGRMTRHRRK
jgi:hypothetical protein